jgi:hypothetical protein
LEEEFLDHIIFWIRNIPLEDIWQQRRRTATREDQLPTLESLGLSTRAHSIDLDAPGYGLSPDRLHLPQMRGELLTLGGPTAARLSGAAAQSQANKGKKWYFEVLHIQPLKAITPLLLSSSYSTLCLYVAEWRVAWAALLTRDTPSRRADQPDGGAQRRTAPK